jgi:hypothetical protein
MAGLQVVGLAFAVFFGVIGAVAVVWAIGRFLYQSKHLAQIVVRILPGQTEQLEYTLRALKHLQAEGRLNIQHIQIDKEGRGETIDCTGVKLGQKL